MKMIRLSEKCKDAVLRRPTRSFAETNLDMVAGFLQPKGKPRTLKAMNAAVEREVLRRHDRGRY